VVRDRRFESFKVRQETREGVVRVEKTIGVFPKRGKKKAGKLWGGGGERNLFKVNTHERPEYMDVVNNHVPDESGS